MSRYSIFIDVKKCSGCYNCFLACRDEYYGNDFPGYSAAQPLNGQFWMQIREVERGYYPKPKVDYVPLPCLHCQDAPCMSAASGGAVYRREDGIVIIDPEKARGQKEIVDACPYRRIYWNDALEIPQKCTLCAHRLDEGETMPRCVESCPTGALVFGDLDDPKSEIAALVKTMPGEELQPEYRTKPQVMYHGIPKRFIAGEVVFGNNRGECAKNVEVELSGGGAGIKTTTDIFGDFEFEGLAKNEPYTLIVKADGYKEERLEVVTARDINLGEIVLSPR